MTVDERLDLNLSAADKQLLAQAAAIEGVSMAAWRAAEAIQLDRQLSLSRTDFTPFQAAIGAPFAANPALQDAIEQACTRVRRG